MSKKIGEITSKLDHIFSKADAIAGSAAFTIRDKNQFYFVLPDGVLPDDSGKDATIPYLRLSPEGQKSVMLTRLAFVRDQNILTDISMDQNRFLIEFSPIMIFLKNLQGQSLIKSLGGTSPADLQKIVSTGTSSGTAIEDIGYLLEGIRRTRKSIDAINCLPDGPSALLTTNDDERKALRCRMEATRDETLISLERLGEAIHYKPEQTVDEWRQEIHNRLSTTIDSILALNQLSGASLDEKRNEMRTLQQSIEGYISHLDPVEDEKECKIFSSCFSQMILDEKKEALGAQLEGLETKMEVSYDALINAIQSMVGNSSAMPKIPYPVASPANGYLATLNLNMIHIVLAVRSGGLSMKLDLQEVPRLYRELNGWDDKNPPRLHIISRSRFAKLFGDIADKIRAQPNHK